MKMCKLWSFSSVLLIILVWGAGLQPQGGFIHQAAGFPHSYVLVVQYSLSTCIVKDCLQTSRRNLPTYFTIHGLWPKNATDEDPPVTNTEEFDSTKFAKFSKELRGDMQHYWFTALTFDNPRSYFSFWKHEWDDHGKKSGLFGLQDYFHTTMEKYKEFDKVYGNIILHNGYAPGIPFRYDQFK